MKPALIFAIIAVASVVGVVRYNQATSPGADIRIPKSEVFQKDQERICPEDATDLTGCAR